MTIATASTQAQAVRQHGGGRTRRAKLAQKLAGRPTRSAGGEIKSLCCAAAGIFALAPRPCGAHAYPPTGVRRAAHPAATLRLSPNPPAQPVLGYGQYSQLLHFRSFTPSSCYIPEVLLSPQPCIQQTAFSQNRVKRIVAVTERVSDPAFQARKSQTDRVGYSSSLWIVLVNQEGIQSRQYRSRGGSEPIHVFLGSSNRRICLAQSYQCGFSFQGDQHQSLRLRQLLTPLPFCVLPQRQPDSSCDRRRSTDRLHPTRHIARLQSKEGSQRYRQEYNQQHNGHDAGQQACPPMHAAPEIPPHSDTPTKTTLRSSLTAPRHHVQRGAA